MDLCLQSFMAGNFTPDCIQLLASKAIGYGIIFFSLILKVPQIKNMLQLKTDKGLSYLSTYSEILVFLFSFLYAYHKGNPFSTYGENVVILVQTLIVLFLSWRYSEEKGNILLRFLFLAGLAAFTVLAMLDLYLPPETWVLISSSTIVLVSISRFSQIWVSFKTKFTGSLSAFTFLLNIFGGLARIFTTITETKDIVLIMNYSYGIFLNVIILAQIFIYGKNKAAVSDKKLQ